MVRTSWNATVAEGNQAVDDLTSPSTEESSTTVAFGDLRAFVLGDDALHLNQQRGLRIVTKRRSIEVANLDSVSQQLVGDQNLIRIAASQSVGGQAPDLIEQTGFGRVAKCIETGTVETRPGVAVVDVFMDHLMPKLGHLEAQHL